jgi:hypothetical protein
MDLSQITLPTWLAPNLHKLMGIAEEIFGSGTGATKKAWVRAALLDAAKAVDVPSIPNWIENPAKEALVDFLIEVVWSLHFNDSDPFDFLRPARPRAA